MDLNFIKGKFSEEQLEAAIIELFQTQNYTYVHGDSIHRRLEDILLLVDDKAQFADWSTRDDIKNQLNMDLTVLLYENGYPPEWDEEVFDKVMEQAENFKKWAQ